jgi:hypothetical protein
MRSLRNGTYEDTIEIRRRFKLNDAHVRRLLRFLYLAPDIIEVMGSAKTRHQKVASETRGKIDASVAQILTRRPRRIREMPRYRVVLRAFAGWPVAAKGKAAFRDIIHGNNGSFAAGAGWDACTGLGSPIAPELISAIKPTSSKSKSKPIASTSKRKTLMIS